MKNLILLACIASLALASCASSKCCPTTNPKYFYQAQGIKAPKALIKNYKGYSKRKY